LVVAFGVKIILEDEVVLVGRFGRLVGVEEVSGLKIGVEQLLVVSDGRRECSEVPRIVVDRLVEIKAAI